MKKQIFKSKGLFWIFPIFLFATHFHTAYGQDYNDLVVTFPYEENLSRLMASQAIDYIRVNKQARDRIENNLKDNGIQLNDFDPKLLRMDYKLVKKLASYTHNAFRISDPDVSEGLRAELRLTNAKLKDEIEAKNGYTFEAAINLKQLGVLFKLFPNPNSQTVWARFKTIGELTDEEKDILKSAMVKVTDLRRPVVREEAPREADDNNYFRD